MQSLKFPQKLWMMANECKTGAIRWSPSGKSVIVHYKRFQDEYLNTSGNSGHTFFKTKNITSFIRQLNLYGFKKVSHGELRQLLCTGIADLHEFRHIYFVKEKPELLQWVTRKPDNSSIKRILAGMSPQPLRVALIGSRKSTRGRPRLYDKRSIKKNECRHTNGTDSTATDPGRGLYHYPIPPGCAWPFTRQDYGTMSNEMPPVEPLSKIASNREVPVEAQKKWKTPWCNGPASPESTYVNVISSPCDRSNITRPDGGRFLKERNVLFSEDFETNGPAVLTSDNEPLHNGRGGRYDRYLYLGKDPMLSSAALPQAVDRPQGVRRDNGGDDVSSSHHIQDVIANIFSNLECLERYVETKSSVSSVPESFKVEESITAMEYLRKVLADNKDHFGS